MDFLDKCPLCGTQGKDWSKADETFRCPNCSSLYSRFGLVVETQKEDHHEFWS